MMKYKVILAVLMSCNLLIGKTFQFMYPEWIPLQLRHDLPFSWNLGIRNDSVFSSYQYLQNNINDMMAFWPNPPNITTTGADANQIASASIANILPILSLKLRPYTLGSFIINGQYTGAFIPLGFLLSTNGLSINTVAFISSTAFLNFKHKYCSFILGLHAHPFCRAITPATVSLNQGLPIAPSAANPQISVSHIYSGFEFWWTAYTQFLNQSTGPEGFSSRYIRRAIIPDLNLIATKKISKNLKIGIGLDYKRLIPLLVNESLNPLLNLASNIVPQHNDINSFIGTIFGILTNNSWTFKAQVIIGQNGTDITNLGGYAIKCQDPISKNYSYKNIWYASAWGEIFVADKEGFCLSPGIFAGYTTNLGAVGCVDAVVAPFAPQGTQPLPQFYGLGPMQYLWRISPRCTLYKSGKFRVTNELEYTNVAWGTFQTSGRITNLQTSQLIRLLLSAQVTF